MRTGARTFPHAGPATAMLITIVHGQRRPPGRRTAGITGSGTIRSLLLAERSIRGRRWHVAEWWSAAGRADGRPAVDRDQRRYVLVAQMIMGCLNDMLISTATLGGAKNKPIAEGDHPAGQSQRFAIAVLRARDPLSLQNDPAGLCGGWPR